MNDVNVSYPSLEGLGQEYCAMDIASANAFAVPPLYESQTIVLLLAEFLYICKRILHLFHKKRYISFSLFHKKNIHFIQSQVDVLINLKNNHYSNVSLILKRRE